MPVSETLAQIESLCPVCLRPLAGHLVRQGQDVLLEKTCPEHGAFSALIWRGAPDFSTWSRPKIPYSGGIRHEVFQRGCPLDCGLCARHAQRTCTALVEITSRCNLGCPVCFAGSTARGTDRSLATLRGLFASVMKTTGGCNLQLSGGEPTLHPELPAIVRAAREAGFSFVQLNTNGLRLAQEPALAEELAEAGLASVFLQFDGLQDEVFVRLRGRAFLAEKKQALLHLEKVGLGVVLVPTIAAGVNTHALWDIVRFGLSHQPTVRGVHFQPLSFFGRVPQGLTTERVTLPEIMTGLETQSEGVLGAGDFSPPGCEHALCSFSARYLHEEDGRLVRLGQSRCACTPRPAEEGAQRSIGVTARQWAAPSPSPLAPAANDLDRFVARAKTHAFSVSAMAFQDAGNVMLERLRGCCIHVAEPDGRLIPFCAFNLTALDGRSLHRTAWV